MAPAGSQKQTEHQNLSIQISKPELEHKKRKPNETKFDLPATNYAPIFQIGYHHRTPVKGGAAVALRPQALDGNRGTQLSLCFYDDTELNEKTQAHKLNLNGMNN